MNGRRWAYATAAMVAVTLAAVALALVAAVVWAVPTTPPPGRLRVCTVNIQNTPDLPDHQVRSDVATARRSCDLVLWQEVGERADYRAVRETLGRRWATTKRARGAVPVSWRRAALNGAGEPQALKVSTPTPRCPSGKASYNPARWITVAPLRVQATGQRVTVVNLHFPQRNGCRKANRAERWRQAYRATRDQLPAGALVIGGDWNRREAEISAMTRWHWVTPSPRALDHIAVARTGWRTTAKFRRPLNSDHALQGAVLTTGR